MKTLTKNVSLLAAILIAIFVTSCKKSELTNPDDTSAHVQLINASPDAGPISLYIMDTLRSVPGVTFGNVSDYANTTAHISREPVAIKSTSGDTLRTASDGFGAKLFYSVYLTGRNLNGGRGILISADDMTLPAAGNARIKFVNAAPVSGHMNVLNTNNNTTVFGGQQYGVTTKYAEMAAGNYTFKLTVNESSSTVTVPMTLVSGRIYTIYARNDIKNGLTVLDAGSFASN